ncbi:M48 family metalloprotease [Thalassobius sp. Cn5-15]|uniref:M48 family metalloprotease n=1 Tax=Thalassobius sp. Cn5-15 TaxID=2917763 RepID=UPI001EF1C44B|nr:M48 family metalloprotease [Thalassobius sp. Cn5-15]MCG7492021.1 M48 family metalloprotease [Thalassobius sp. Cn5-15]
MTRCIHIVAMVIILALQPMAARAVTLLRDPDIENGLSVLAKPVLDAAGLPSGTVKVLVIQDPSLNAFVVDTRHIFLHSGLIMKLKSAAALQAVIAHEAAHIANGHLARRPQAARSSRSAAALGVALAVAAAAAGADPSAAGGIAIGSQSTADRLFKSHTRAEESSADASAIRYLASARVDPHAFAEVLELFRGQELLSEHRQDPYARTHPLSRDRLRAVKALAAGVQGKPADSSTADYWFARAQGKLSAFQRAPSWTLRRAKDSTSADIRLMRQAIAYHRNSQTQKALSHINQAIAKRPNDPYLHELRGQILLENRQISTAVNAYGRAAKLAPRDALILGGQGRALLLAGQHKSALTVLERARQKDFRNSGVLRDMGTAYAQLGQPGHASLVTAERYALRGDFKSALIHSKRASGLLPRGSAPWRRAQDVLSQAEKQAKISKRK